MRTVDENCLGCDSVEKKKIQRVLAPLPPTSKGFLRELSLKQIIVFPDINGHLRSSGSSARSTLFQTVASLIYMGTQRVPQNLKPALT